MLITTWTGILVSTDHVAYVALKRHPAEDLDPMPADGAPRHKVLLFLANRDTVIAAAHLTRSAAECVRREIGRAWSESEPALNVNTVLKRHGEDASFAEEAEE